MASTARTSLTRALSQATKLPSLRIPFALPCTCSVSASTLPSRNSTGTPLRFQSTSAGVASSSSASSSAILPASSSSSNSTATDIPTRTQIKTPKGTKPISHSTASALALLRSQPSHYIIASIYQRRFLLTPRDVVTVPRLKDVQVGDVIRLDKIHEVGSRDYTLRATDGEFLRDAAVHVQATVVEHTKGKMEATVKFKKRKGYTKTIKTKSKYTRLRVGEIVLGEGQ